MLTSEELTQIARSTRYRWYNFQHQEYFGAEMVEEHIQGMKPDRDKFKREKEKARKERYQHNINFEDCPVLIGLTF